MKYPNYTTERSLIGIIAGIDEAGRGPWAGPVVAAIVILDKKKLPKGVNDSKLLPRPKREALFEVLQATAVCAVGVCTSQEIDHLNILGATKEAMLRAFHACPVKPDTALVDGNRLPELPCSMQEIIAGDRLCLSIAAASIIAKVTRDRMMGELAQQFPHYGWEKNAGYGTREHQEALARHGICVHHRKSFAPIRELLQKAVA